MPKSNNKRIFTEIEVLDAGAKGKAVAKAPDGRVIFVSNAVPGDVVDIQTLKKRKAYYEGKAIAFHKKSDKRVTAACKHFGVCGGCKWQNMAYNHQLFYKQQEVTNNFKRIGNLQVQETISILGCDDPYYYRNKMEFTFSNNRWLSLEEIKSDLTVNNKNALGFHISGMWDKVLDITECYLQAEPSNSIRNTIKTYAQDHNLSFYNIKTKTGLLRTLMIRTTLTGEVMVLIQFGEDAKTKREALLNFLIDKFPQITSLLYVINLKDNDTIYDLDVICYFGRDYILENMEGLKFKITAKSFYQTNSKQAYELYKIVRDFAQLEGHELVYDLYTGAGTIAQFIAKKAKHVIGIESVPDAVKAAKENASLNAINNTEFFTGDMKTVLNDSFINNHGRPDIIITDPPRDGMHKDVIANILNIAPNKIVYVSCNSATQARDLELLKDLYKIVKSQAVDMFPQTHHIENVVLLEKHRS